MEAKRLVLSLLVCFLAGALPAQTATQHFDKLVLKKKEKKVFSDRDSSNVIHIDTLIMKDKSSLQFFGKKEVTIRVNYAEIGDQVMIVGQAGQNNGSNFDIKANFQKLGSLYIIARGRDAMNGTKTFPNGDAGNITLTYDPKGVTPQTSDKKAKNYLLADVTPGGLHVTPTAELSNIYSMIARAPQGLRGLPQGQIYSGSPGKEGVVVIKSK